MVVGWGLAVTRETPLTPALPSSPFSRLDLKDIPNSVRLVAPDVGVLLVSSLCLCLCRCLVPKASAATRSQRPESLQPPEQVSPDPGAIRGVSTTTSSPSPCQISWAVLAAP